MTDATEMGPIDYIIIEWTGHQPDGSALPHLIDLVDNGIINILDIAFITKADDGSWAAVAISDLGDEFAVFEGASSGLLGDDEMDDAAGVLEPGTSAAVLVWENAWAAPFATALRKNGAQLVASGRIPTQALVAAVDEQFAAKA